MSANYTTAHGNTGSLTHCARPGIEPASSWMLVRFVSTESQQEFFFKACFTTRYHHIYKFAFHLSPPLPRQEHGHPVCSRQVAPLLPFPSLQDPRSSPLQVSPHLPLGASPDQSPPLPSRLGDQASLRVMQQCWRLGCAQHVSLGARGSDMMVQTKKTKRHVHNWHRRKKSSQNLQPTEFLPLVPSGDHRCLVTAEICLPEAGTREYFWPN